MSRIDPDTLRTWATDLLRHVGVRDDDAAIIAGYLVDVDLRGIKTHGTRQLRRYVNEYVDGRINPAPEIRVLRDGDSHIRLDGDGGAGYLVATRATDIACDKARHTGLALATTCNHGHVGSAGIYARRALPHGLISWCVAGGNGWRKPGKPGATVWEAMGAPPMCFGVPADDGGPPLVLDMNANQFRAGTEEVQAALAAGFHRSVFGSLGMRFVSTLLAGQLAGALDDGVERTYSAATRGLFFVAIDPDLVGDGAAWRADVRRVLDDSLTLAPIPGTDAAALPGTVEWRRENKWVTAGIPIPDDHRELLEGIAHQLGLEPPPWTG